jgi:S-(hydroxymethyl)glutathione dehydrogenase/alcohol dehydrogenase
MKIKAAVFRAENTPIKTEEITLSTPKDDEVLVKIEATGICHSDIHVITGNMKVPLPIVLGHEGAGIVEQVGKNVKHTKVGDHIALSWAPECKNCHFCITGKPHLCDASAPIVLDGTLLDGTTRLTDENGEKIYHYSFLSTWAEYAVVPAASCIPIDKDLPFAQASLIGCAVMTGIGAAVNTAKVHPGSSVAIFGMGGVGLNIVQGAKLCGAEKIIAFDISDEKKKIAQRFGATHFINSKETQPIEAINEITNGFGVDYTFEAVGHPALMRSAYDITKRAGTIVYIGIAPDGVDLKLPALKIPREEKIITGSFYGSANPQRDFLMLGRLYQQGKILLDELVTDIIDFQGMNNAIDKVHHGDALRIVLQPHQ